MLGHKTGQNNKTAKKNQVRFDGYSFEILDPRYLEKDKS